MESFWAFVNRRSVRFALAAFCVTFMVQGIFHVFEAPDNRAVFRGAGEILLFGGWAVSNTLHAYGKFMPRIGIAINTGLAMIVVSWFMK